MTAIAYHQLDSQTFGEVMARIGVVVTEVEDLSGKVPHVGYGGAAKSSYWSTKSNRTIYVLERNGAYAADAYLNDVWQFAEDFTAEEAREFIAAHDRQREAAKVHAVNR